MIQPDSKLRILQVIASADPRGGGPIQAVKSLAAALMAAGHQVDRAALDAPNADYIRQFPHTLFALGPGCGKYGYSNSFQNWMSENAHNYDTVVVHGIWQFCTYAVWRALKTTTIPYFVFTHGMLDPWFNRAYPLKHAKKALYWRLVESRVLRDAAAVLFTAEEEQHLASRSFSPYRCTERVIRYGVEGPPFSTDESQAAFFERFPHLQGKRLVLFLGRMHAKKRGDFAIRAFNEVKDSAPSLHLVMAGPDDSDMAPEWQRLGEALGLQEKITWTGMLDGAQKWGALCAADVFMLPSHQENFGIAVAEALACGTPVLISRRVNIWKEIVAAGAGLAAEDTQDGTTGILKEYLHTPPEIRAAMRSAAVRCWRERFQIQHTVEDLMRIFHEFGVGMRKFGA